MYDVAVRLVNIGDAAGLPDSLCDGCRSLRDAGRLAFV